MVSFAVLLFTTIFNSISPNAALCDSPAPSDAAVLFRTLTEAADTIIRTSVAHPPSGESVIIEAGPGIDLLPIALDAVAAVYTRNGYSIADSSATGHRIVITVTDAGVTVRKSRKHLARRITMTVHVHWHGPEGSLLFTGRQELRTDDRVPSVSIGATDDSRIFSGDVRRVELSRDTSRLRLAALSAITAVLVWFAFE